MQEISTNRPSLHRSPRRIGALLWLFLIVVASAAMAPIQMAIAHGAVGYPISRQYQCRLEGEYWGAPSLVPSADCRQAYIAGGGQGPGSWPFQQWNELSANPIDWGNNQAELEKAVPNGLLCAAGDPRKAGLDNVPATMWRKTTIAPKDGKIDVVWENTQDHNPSTMRIYLSKTSYDPTKPLKWEDLQKIYEEPSPAPTPAHGEGHLPGDVRSFYVLHVPIPAGRTGDAVLYSYWQRHDSGNEGFFNCSDITIAPDEGTPGFPWLEERQYLPHGFVPKVGDQVRFRVMGGSKGLEVIDIHHPITQQNYDLAIWPKELAEELNSKHANFVQIGVRSDNEIHFDPTNLLANRVWLKSGYSSAMSIVGNPPEPDHPVAHIAGPDTVQEHTSATFSGQQSQGEQLSYHWTLQHFTPATATDATVTGTAGAATQPLHAKVTLTVTDSHDAHDSAEETVTIVPKGSEPDYPKWDRKDVGSYGPGTKVTGLDGKVWVCKDHPYSDWCKQMVPASVTDENWPYAAGSAAAASQPEDHRAWALVSGT